MIQDFKDKKPKYGKEVFIAPNAWVIGDVELGDNVTIFFSTVLRGDILPIKIGSRTNIQEHSLLHTSHGRTPTIVGNDVTIGHRAIVHGCTIADSSLIGMGATVLDEAVIEEECIIAAGALVPEGKRIPKRSLVMGVPGKIVRDITDEDLAYIKRAASDYVKVGLEYQSLIKTDSYPSHTKP